MSKNELDELLRKRFASMNDEEKKRVMALLERYENRFATPHEESDTADRERELAERLRVAEQQRDELAAQVTRLSAILEAEHFRSEREQVLAAQVEAMREALWLTHEHGRLHLGAWYDSHHNVFIAATKALALPLPFAEHYAKEPESGK